MVKAVAITAEVPRVVNTAQVSALAVAAHSGAVEAASADLLVRHAPHNVRKATGSAPQNLASRVTGVQLALMTTNKLPR